MQKKIVKKIIAGKADYNIGLKSNQPILYKDVEDYFLEFEKELSCIKTYDKGHGRIKNENTDFYGLNKKRNGKAYKA